MKRSLVLVTIVVVLFAAWRISKYEDARNIPDKVDTNQTASSAFNKQLYSIDNPDSLWVIVNKNRKPLPREYKPSALDVPQVTLKLNDSNEQMLVDSRAKAPLEELFAAAKKAGHGLTLASGYRSYDYQVQVYNGFVATEGRAEAERSSAKPGYSEHQTGLAVDVCNSSDSCLVLEKFSPDSPAATWLASNAPSFGFIIRYPADKESVTGYKHEPWHLRFVGKELAQQVQQTGKTLEEFFQIQ